MNSRVHCIRVLMPNIFIFSASASYGYLSSTNASWQCSTNESQSPLRPWRCNTSSLKACGVNSMSCRFLSLALVAVGSCRIIFLKLCSLGQSPVSTIRRHLRYVSKASAESTTYAIPRWSLCPTVVCAKRTSLASWNTIPAWNIFTALCFGGIFIPPSGYAFLYALFCIPFLFVLALFLERKESAASLCGTYRMVCRSA